MRTLSPAVVASLLGCLTLSFLTPATAAVVTVGSTNDELEPTCDVQDGSCVLPTDNTNDGGRDIIEDHNIDIVEDGDEPSLSLQQKVIDWVVGSGGYFNDKQELRPLPHPHDDTFGVFAAEDIGKGEVLARVPGRCIVAGWNEKLDGKPFNSGGTYYCGTTALLLEEAALEEDSKYAPYLEFLTHRNPGELPFNWSDKGRDLLEAALGRLSTYKEHVIPPKLPFNNQEDYKKRCDRIDFIEEAYDDDGDNIETQLAMQVMQRSYFEHMIPVFDFYNHANGQPENLDVEFNMDAKTEDLQMVEVLAWRDIAKGEQLFRSYNQVENMGDRATNYYGTPDFLRDYGFVEGYPQRWTIVNSEIKVGFDLNHKNMTSITVGDDVDMDDLEVKWLKWHKMNFSYPVKAYFRRHLHRLDQSVEPMLRQVEQQLQEKDLYEEDDLPSEREFFIVRKYVDAVKVAYHLFLKAANEYELNGPRVNPYREIRREQGERDPFDHESFPTYNEQFYAMEGRDDGWENIDEEDSGYQTIRFMSHDGDKNVCFVLDGEPQTCSYFSAHYHDLACHFPTRYLESVKRVAIIGGGDSKMLHEVLQYNKTLEKVIHLELDQKGTRKCFKYFASEPHFDDDRIEWYFGDAAKSLLMIPSEYFGTFDLVFVDLSESGPLSLAVTSDLTVWDSIAQLVSPDGYVALACFVCF